MMAPQIPLTRDLVLIGGGHTHALVLRMWGMNPLPGARLTLVSPHPAAAYSGMLPGFVAGHYAWDDLALDLVRLARHAGARLILGRAEGIDLAARTVTVAGRPPVGFDVLSIDIGITSDMPAVPGFAEHAVPAKPLDGFARRWEAFVSAGGGPVAVVGGGIAGLELALAARHRLGASHPVTVIEAGEALALAGPAARRAILRAAAATGVDLVENCAAAAVEAGGVRLADGRRIPAAFVAGAAATRAPDWIARCGLATHEGFVTVGPTLQSPTDPAVFAAGDVAHMAHAPRPKAGVFAVRQAPILLHNLTAALTGQGRMRSYRPQADYLKLVSLGQRRAVADKWGLRAAGPAIWAWKDRIDRRFMAMFHDLPGMPAPALPRVIAAGAVEEYQVGKPMCAGCGAKAGRRALAAGLAHLPAPVRPDVLRGAGEDAAVLAHGRGGQVFTTDHLRAVCEDPWLMATIAAVHALGDIWAMGATPQAALAQITLPRMSEALQERSIAEIMDGAARVFRAAGADIVGGHTSLGIVMTIGFAVTGLCDRPVGQSGARPGDALILTKAIGTGVILAAEMLGAARGEDVAAAWAAMARPQGDAAAILAPVAHAMTDVTGFGLAGHLGGLIEASGVSAQLDLGAVPVLPGAEALAAAGHASTLAPSNRAAAAATSFPEGPRAALLFDPQTGGGLLAAVPPGAAADLVKRLVALGHPAAVIGTVGEGPPHLDVR
ncbi:MAG: selenide, water dikinase SelD [Rhodobacteraceae bacterium]|nr:selenide, water dikinase SelD [Paracoccaceae bacterium]